ncbi:Ubiquitin carboxyl-terminal hydrolase ZUFSP [Vanrija pseudolonga]|uniref:Ubiquitin carboxyl-terminal hydrolase ZUFSP n=1 Tax=Vanrija pseudolonga TaxID=143232 RepID=A0AAF0Y393_9TREE|nr:Ubiquitin carboxyl-terminal hydrolase ZUFSP [Vanrija pseudolonga]
MPTCPVCDQVINADDTAFEHHVNAHFDGSAQPGQQNGTDGGNFLLSPPLPSDDEVEFLGQSAPESRCFVCATDLSSLSETARNAHVSDCLDSGGVDAAPQRDRLSQDSDFYLEDPDTPNDISRHVGKGRRLDGLWNGAVLASLKPGRDREAKGDDWWDPIRGGVKHGNVPSNFSPGLIPVLRDMLLKDVSKRQIRSAVLASGGVHIKSNWTFDGTWGCGYRNAEMVISALVSEPPYREVFPNPGVRAIQSWIEDAWRAGYDPEGRFQLQDKLLGTRKWIGTSDLYAMFSARGVRCTLYDFDKPGGNNGSDEPAFKRLQRWVKNYFDGDDGVGLPGSVRISTQLPVILQHSGHSRSIVGYEETAKGDINLLIFDPAKTIPKDVRSAGIEQVRQSRNGVSRSPTVVQTTLSSEPDTRAREGDEAAELSEDDEVGPGGWVRRRKLSLGKGKQASNSTLPSSLGVFRVNMTRFSSHTKYQVLAFTGGSLLTPEERLARQTPTSTIS